MAVVFSSIRPRGFLSFPPDSHPIELRDLNVLIGPNSSGKSNLVEALDVLRAAPGDLPYPIRQGGGVQDWLWRGAGNRVADRCSLEVVIGPDLVALMKPPAAVRYRLDFGKQGTHFVVLDERIENAEIRAGAVKPYFYFGYENAGPTLNIHNGKRVLRREDINSTQSILSQRKDPETYPELSRLSNLLQSISIYRSWSFGPNAPIRRPCAANEPADRLNEAMDNLPVRIMAMKQDDDARAMLLDVVRRVSDGFTDFDIVLVPGGALQVVIVDGDRRFSAHRLSDGTMRMLALAAILIHPKPNSVLVIEEPELGLHPDLMPTVRDLLLHAAERAQVIVTTHSTVLADAFTHHPEAVCVVEREEGSTITRRLSARDLEAGGADGLGWQWMSGAFGGTRW